MADDADEPRPPAQMLGVPTLHPHRPYRSPQFVTGEAANLLDTQRRQDDSPAETLEELMRRLRELCRLMAYASALDDACARFAPSQELPRKHADATRLLEHMFRRAAIDLEHVGRNMPGTMVNSSPTTRRVNDKDESEE
jgi:hypothetical protein